MNVATADSGQRQATGTHGSQELADIFESFSITSKPWKTDLSNLGMALLVCVLELASMFIIAIVFYLLVINLLKTSISDFHLLCKTL